VTEAAIETGFLCTKPSQLHPIMESKRNVEYAQDCVSNLAHTGNTLAEEKMYTVERHKYHLKAIFACA
jgi:CCR4-NOT transcriptional regulation complex NOT5 subunit